MTDQITGLPVAGSTIGSTVKGQKAPVAAAEVRILSFSLLIIHTPNSRARLQTWMMTWKRG